MSGVMMAATEIVQVQGSREGLVAGVIAHLDPANPDHWNRDNKPQVGALEELLGYYITVAERDRAWIRYCQERAAAMPGG